MCGKLDKAMYGTRDAAQNWERQYEQVRIGLGFTQGKSSPCVFLHSERDIRTVVHGDDFSGSAVESVCVWCEQLMKANFLCKRKALLGPAPHHDKCMRALTGVLRGEEPEMNNLQ